jgi:DNA helicase-2/ATP-dependent DNA helicase PcrA
MEPIIKPNLRYMAVVLQGSKGYEPRRGVISLSTQHKAKGLEWDAVYIVGLAADQFFENVGRKNRSEVWCLAERYKNPLAMAHAQLMFLSGEKCPGNVRQWANINQISEDLRLLYVSFTRARRYLWISSHKYDPWKKVLPTSKIFEEIQRYIKEKRNA